MLHSGGALQEARSSAGRWPRVVAAFGAVLLLAACTAQSDASPTPPPTERPQPTASASATPVMTAPSARVTASCDELVPTAIVATALAEDVSLRPIGFDSTSDGPVAASLLQLGSVNCVWANGANPSPGETASTVGFRSANLSVVPDGATPWQAYAATYGAVQEEPSAYGDTAFGPRCVAAIESCFFQALVGTSWVDLTVTGIGVAGGGSVPSDGELVTLVTPVTDAIVQRLSAEPPHAPRWEVPATVLPLPADCTGFITDAQTDEFSAASPFRVGVFWDGPRVGQTNHGMKETGAQRCHLNMAGSDSGIGYLDYLPGGGWGFDALRQEWEAAGVITADTVAGLRAEDAALIRCGVHEAACTADIRFGGNWVQLSLTAYVPDQITYPEGVDIHVARDNIDAFAEAIVANLNGTVG